MVDKKKGWEGFLFSEITLSDRVNHGTAQFKKKFQSWQIPYPLQCHTALCHKIGDRQSAKVPSFSVSIKKGRM